jgi:hypothetical protein
MLQNPAHDVWMTIIALVDDVNTLKMCNLVCTRWHLRLQARLLSFKWDTNPLTAEDLHKLQLLSYLVRTLTVERWNATVTQPQDSLPPLAIFRNLKKLYLYNVSLYRFGELQDYLSGAGLALDTVQFTECLAGDEHNVFASAMLEPFEAHTLALRELQLYPLADDTFNTVMLKWLASSPTLYTLHTLGLSVMYQDSALLDSLASFVVHPACKLEELDLSFWNYSGYAHGESSSDYLPLFSVEVSESNQ